MKEVVNAIIQSGGNSQIRSVILLKPGFSDETSIMILGSCVG
jgi:hypothetical protein